MALVKLRARLRAEGSRQFTSADRRTNEQAIAVARGQAALPPFIAVGTSRWQAIRCAYEKAAAALDVTGQAEDRELAADVRNFLVMHQGINATPEVFAARYAQNFAMKPSHLGTKRPERSPQDRGQNR